MTLTIVEVMAYFGPVAMHPGLVVGALACVALLDEVRRGK